MEKEIKYIGFYDLPDSKFKRVSTLSATRKMDYICDAINKAGFKVHLISPSWFDDTPVTIPFHKTKTIDLEKDKKFTSVFGFGGKNKLSRNLVIISSLVWLFFKLLNNTKKNEKILVYHSPWLTLPVLLVKKIKGLQIILEVEEIYSDVSSLHPYFDKLEQKIFKKADSFLFSTDLLVDKMQTSKPYSIIYGEYTVYPKLASTPDDGKIHLVYAGIIDSIKRGALNAVESAAYLSENFVLHIIGFGEVDLLLKKIKEISAISKCEIVFHGKKAGEEYIRFCQTCHIGLSTQKMEGGYLDTSFPSKILSYLGMGLQVVSCAVPCVEESKIGKEVTYYYKDNPEDIANAIVECSRNLNGNSHLILKELNTSFINDLNRMLTDRNKT